jgi:tripartite-type tricarboxylate transporter receptor subunit TctC
MRTHGSCVSAFARLAATLGVILPLAAVAVSAASAQDYPRRPIQMVIPFGPGGATDIIFRLVAEKAEEHLGGSIVAVNMAGAVSTVGSRHVRNARPDGYTILATHDTIVMAEAVGIVDYGPDAFEPIAMITTTPNIATVRADAPWDTMRDFLDDIEARPGEITWSAAVGTNNYTFIAAIFDDVGMDLEKLRLVSYDDTASELNALLGGHVDAIILNVAAGAEYVRAGQVKFIGVAHDSRLPGFEDVPTLQDLGIDVLEASNRGLFAPKGTPEPILAALEDAFEKAVNDPEIVERLNGMGTLVNFKNREEYRAFLTESSELTKRLLESAQ